MNALNFGAGLGVSLPFLISKYAHVVACDLDPKITGFMINKLKLQSVELISDLDRCVKKFDVIVGLNVLEHVDDLARTLHLFISHSNEGAAWIISSPTENTLYKRGMSGISTRV